MTRTRKSQNTKAERAYANLEFLNSPAGRTIRILAEFLEPMRRFRIHKIRDTVVFFGSARVLPPDVARLQLIQAQRHARSLKRASARAVKRVMDAEVQTKMSRYYQDAVTLSTMLTRWARDLDGHQRFVICSGGGPGIMEAANKGAILAGGKSIGLNITLPFEQFSNPYVSPGLDFEFHYFFMRKFWFVYLAKALVVFPGGFGTMDELMEVLTLVQTKKVKKRMALVMYGKEYWNEILNFDAMIRHKVISKDDLRLFKLVDSPEEAFEYMKRRLTRKSWRN